MRFIIVRPWIQMSSASEAVQFWRAGKKFIGMNDAPTPCTNQDFNAGEEIEIRWNYPESFTDTVIIKN